MRIGLLTYDNASPTAGNTVYKQKLTEQLRQHGHRVDLINLPRRNYWRHLADNGRYRLLRWLAEFKLDVMIQDEMSHPSLVWMNEILRANVPFPIVSLVHLLKTSRTTLRPLNLFYGRIERSYLRNLDGMIFTSQTTRRNIAEMFRGLPAHVVAPPGGDRFEKVRLGVREVTARAYRGNLRLLYVGALIPRKGLHTIIRAMANHPSAELTVVGDATVNVGYTQKIYRLIENLGLFGRIHFHSTLTDADLVEQYRQAHLLVMPSHHESFGITYLEGMGFGLPAIGTTRGAAHELISHEENGFLIPLNDAQALTNYLRQVDGDRELLTAMGTAALTRFRQHPTWEESMARVREFLEGL